jgi:hypothetical protein
MEWNAFRDPAAPSGLRVADAAGDRARRGGAVVREVRAVIPTDGRASLEDTDPNSRRPSPPGPSHTVAHECRTHLAILGPYAACLGSLL